MRIALIVAAALFAQPAFAKSWSDVSCSVSLVSENDTFTFGKDGAQDVKCKIESWPIASAKAKMRCDDGSMPSLSLLSGNRVVFAGLELQEVTEDGPVCD
ncbi:hypothetical protein ACHMW7_09155 [Aminobacter sp. UC22_36]|uniref:hypothetical protein n=1 Tax=Aminobacter sp. UC22_36 TaxID=3374549 RepID=UPI00375821C1